MTPRPARVDATLAAPRRWARGQPRGHPVTRADACQEQRSDGETGRCGGHGIVSDDRLCQRAFVTRRPR